MQRTFQFVIPWAEAFMKLKNIRRCGIPYEVGSVAPGMLEIYLLDLPHRVYNRVLFNENGLLYKSMAKSIRNK